MGSSFADISDLGDLGGDSTDFSDIFTSSDSLNLSPSIGASATPIVTPTIGVSPMSASPVDLSSMQQLSFGGGQTGYYDPNTNTYYDSGFNVLSPSDLAQYGAFTVTGAGQTPSTAPVSLGSGGTSTAPVSPVGSAGTLAGLTSMFGSLGNAIVNATKPTIATPTGTLVYNPSTGGYTTTAALTASSALSPMILLLLGGVLLWVLLKEEK